uniref:CCHC-type domain-containing protein n=1 Tax=Amphimedon queenslandica TaxID=400682 RepID=A0A1X7VAQ5_AMPQE
MKPSNKQSGGIHTVKGKQPARSSPTCHRCGGPHLAPACRFINEKCRACGKTAHIAEVCRSQSKEKQRSTAGGSRQKEYRDTSSYSTHLVDQLSSNSDAYTDA